MKQSGKETPRKMASGPATVDFQKLCEKYGITPTKRQYSKFRNGKGRLYNAIHKSEA